MVFSQFTTFLDLIQTVLERERLMWYRFDGTMDIKKKNEAILSFKESSQEPKVLIVSLKAGGVGLNVSSGPQAFLTKDLIAFAAADQCESCLHGKCHLQFMSTMVLSI